MRVHWRARGQSIQARQSYLEPDELRLLPLLLRDEVRPRLLRAGLVLRPLAGLALRGTALFAR